MTATHSTKWFWSDWLGDQEVRRLTPAERGVWIDLLALAAVGSPYGYVCDDRGRKLSDDYIARVTNAGTVEEVSRLIAGILEKGAASRDRAGRLFNRRMVREKELSAKRKRNGSLGGERTKLIWQGFKSLPRQNARQTPGQDEGPLIPIKKITSSEYVPREAVRGEQEESPSVIAMRERLERAKRARG